MSEAVDAGIRPEAVVACPQMPDQITRDWVEEALKAGGAERNGRTFFIRKFSDSPQEANWLISKHGMSDDREGYFYHGTGAEKMPVVADYGIFGVKDHPTLSTLVNDEARGTARNRGKTEIGLGVVVVLRAPWTGVEGLLPGDGAYEPIGWPATKYEGSRANLPLPDHLKNNPDLRNMPPTELLGFYVVDSTVEPDVFSVEIP